MLQDLRICCQDFTLKKIYKKNNKLDLIKLCVSNFTLPDKISLIFVAGEYQPLEHDTFIYNKIADFGKFITKTCLTITRVFFYYLNLF